MTERHDPGEELVRRTIELSSGALVLRQPRESAEVPDDGGVEWAPMAPYWSVLWRSGVALARELSTRDLAGVRVVELGCGLGVPSLAAARAGADVVASDADPEALALLAANATANNIRLATATVDWSAPGELLALAPFDLVLAADVLYDQAGVTTLMTLLPRLAPEVVLADPGRPAAVGFLEWAGRRWDIRSRRRGVVAIHRMASPARTAHR